MNTHLASGAQSLLISRSYRDPNSNLQTFVLSELFNRLVLLQNAELNVFDAFFLLSVFAINLQK